MKDYYGILGVASDASAKEIRKAWLILVQQYHPDHNPENPESSEFFLDVQLAYETLSDVGRRKAYDLMLLTGAFKDPVPDYFTTFCSQASVALFQEIHVSFSYTGQGRLFRRPSFDGFHVASAPYVTHRLVLLEGIQTKETTLTFVVCPVKKGILHTGNASVQISGNSFTAPSSIINAGSSQCFFSRNSDADTKPLLFSMFYIFPAREKPYKVGEHMRVHTILIPRSRTALAFHRIGSAMKIVFTFWGLTYFHNLVGMPFIAGAFIGNFIGGVNTAIMYRLAGVRPAGTGTLEYPAASAYLERGFHPGSGSAWPLDRWGVLYGIRKYVL